jgi:hypothetical protein
MTGKADRIQRLVDDPDIKASFQNIREKYRDMIEETPVGDDTALLDVRKMLHLLRDVENDLQTAIEDGHLEDHRVAEQERQKDDL